MGRQFLLDVLPPGLIFPRSGQIWEAVRDCEVYGFSARRLPILTTVRLRQGDKVRILDLDHPKPLDIKFRPIQPAEGSDDECFMRIACTLTALKKNPEYFIDLFRLVQEAG